MSRIKRLIKNLRYLSKINLKKVISEHDAIVSEESLENILYYIPNSSVLRPNVIDANATLDILVSSDKSIARFGDGEIFIINGTDIPFQSYDARLATRLREILQNKDDKLLVGINHWYFFPTYDSRKNDLVRTFAIKSVPKLRKNLIKHLDFSTQYVDAGFTNFRPTGADDDKLFFEKLRSVWDKRDVVLVGCREAHEKYIHDLFDNASSETWVYTPNTNAFSEYDNILNKIKEYPTNAIIILMVGPTANVLAYDLAHSGYRALDLGHIAKSYDYYMRNVIFTTKIESDFFKPDL